MNTDTASRAAAQGIHPSVIAAVLTREIGQPVGVTATDDPFDPENWADPDAEYAIWAGK